MFNRPLCLLLCVGVIHTNAYPAPQDAKEESIYDAFKIDDLNPSNDEPTLARQESAVDVLAIEEPSSENVATESGDDTESSADETQESSNEDVSIVPILEESSVDDLNNDNVFEESDGDNQESSSTEPESKVESNTKNNPEKSGDDNDQPRPNESSDDNSDNSNSDDGESNTEESNDNPKDPANENHPNEPCGSEPNSGDGIPVILLSDIFVGERQLRVVAQDDGYEKRICQILLGKNEELLDKECFTLRPINPYLFGRMQEFVVLDRKIIEGEKYLCQGVLNPLQGLLQQLCVTHNGWIFNPVRLQDNLILFK